MIVVLVLIVAAFSAGWLARGSHEAENAGEEEGDGAEATAPPLAPVPAIAAPPRAAAPASAPLSSGARPDPARDTARALSLAAAAYETAVDRWLDERDEITPAGRASVSAVEQAVQRLDRAATRLDETDEELADLALDALDALRDGTRHLEVFRSGRALDAATSRELDRVEETVERARRAFEAAAV